jgi:hypothetical protein
MQFDVSRDFLDGLLLQQPHRNEGQADIQASGGLHFLPSSPDGTMHTAVVSFSLQIGGTEQPFARAGWRFLFTTDERFDPRSSSEHPFMRQLLVNGAAKILTVLNGCCLHANLPVIPVDARQLAQQLQRPGAAAPQAPQPI